MYIYIYIYIHVYIYKEREGEREGERVMHYVFPVATSQASKPLQRKRFACDLQPAAHEVPWRWDGPVMPAKRILGLGHRYLIVSGAKTSVRVQITQPWAVMDEGSRILA